MRNRSPRITQINAKAHAPRPDYLFIYLLIILPRLFLKKKTGGTSPAVPKFHDLRVARKLGFLTSF